MYHLDYIKPGVVLILFFFELPSPLECSKGLLVWRKLHVFAHSSLNIGTPSLTQLNTFRKIMYNLTIII